MADESFEIESEVPPPPVPPSESGSVSGSARKGRASLGSTTSGGDSSRVKLCQYPTCDLDCKQGRRHCSHHNRHLDNSRTQVRSKYGAEGLKSFSDKCRDIEFANQQIEYMAARSVGLSMFARAPLIDFAQWEQQFGVLVETRQATQTRPFEETEWILRQVNKYGREKEEAASDWKQKLAGPWKRDYAGHGGKIRLWLPSKEYEEKGSSQFIQGASKEVSKSKKNPKEFELEAFRLHAVEAGFNHGHSFFGGVPMSTDDDDEQADGEPSSQAQQPVPQKRKAVADTLDAT